MRLPSLRSPSLLVLFLASACGGGEGGREGGEPEGPRVGGDPPHASDGVAGAPPGAPPDDQRPPAPARLFSSRFSLYGSWFDELVRRLDPAYPGDPWDTEVLAGRARRVLGQGLEGALQGHMQGFAPALGKRFAPSSALRPAAPEPVFEGAGLEGGGVVVWRGRPEPLSPGPENLGPSALERVVAELVAPYRGMEGARVEVWVTGCRRVEEGFETRGHLRLSGRQGVRRRQANVKLEATWRVAPKRVVLMALGASDFEEIELERATFSELTGQVLGAAAGDGGWIWEGALRQTSRTDNLVPFTDVYLGMHGMAVADLDGDGLEDLYVARQGGLPNVLLRHLPDGSAVDVASEAGVDFLDDTCGVLACDLDGDGARDLALAVGADVVLCWNDGAGRFPATTRLECVSKDKVYTLVAADADGDGDLDLYDTRYFASNYGAEPPTPYHDAHNGAPNFFWRNAGERVFREDTRAAGLDADNDRFSLAALWEDGDGDGDLDLYVVNDFGRNNFYRNEGGVFADVADELGLSDMAAGMGITCADVDLDGDLDLYVSNMFSEAGQRITEHEKFMPGAPPAVRGGYQRHTRGNTLLANRGDGFFVDASESGLAGPGGWSWGSVFTDFDNDALPDLIVPNGFLTGRDPRDLEAFFWRCVVNASPPRPPAGEAYNNAWQAITRLSQHMGYSWNGNERNYGYWNLGGAVFADASSAAGLDQTDDTRVACPVDWDGDGRCDLWLKNRTAPVVRFLRNVHPAPGNWVAVELTGRAPNTEAIGALVEITVEIAVESGGQGGTIERTTRRRVYAGEGFLGSPSRRLHFGLGEATRLARLRVTWPDGTRSELTDLPVGVLQRVAQEGAGLRPAWPPSPLEDGPGEALPTRSGPPAPRAVALERVPFSSLPLPRFDGEAGRVAEHAGRVLLVPLWGSWDEGAAADLAALGRASRSLEAAGIDLHPISLDGPRAHAYAGSVARAAGLPEAGGRADRRLRTLVEIALQAVLPGYDDLPVPLGLLFDPRGRLCVVYVAELDPRMVLADGVALLGEREIERGTRVLTGGRWLGRAPERRYEGAGGVIEFLRHRRGERELADELEAFARGR